MRIKQLLLILVICCTTNIVFGQNTTELIFGEVSFVTSKNIYVRFDNTTPMEVGDTLYYTVKQELKPCLIVSQKSSSSCVCTVYFDYRLGKSDRLVFKNMITINNESSLENKDSLEIVKKNPSIKKKRTKNISKEKIRGRLSASTYSSLSAEKPTRHRMMYRFSLNALHFKESKFSFESYLNYRQNFISLSDTYGRKTNFFRVYNLALRYDVDSTLTLLIGRKINNKASSLGAIDGFQGEKKLGRNYFGLLAGFRPDIYEYDFNSDLLQYGVYFGREIDKPNVYARSTFGFLEQRNLFHIDRRYLYLQHSSVLFKKINLYGSMEVDIYNIEKNIPKTEPRLTNMYLSARYRLNRKVNFSASYDTRKRILYFETYKTEIEKLLDDDIARQGLRFRVNVRPFKRVNMGVSYGKRFQSDQQNKSENINGFISISKLPKIGGRAAVNFNLNNSNYLQSKILSLRYSRGFFKSKLNTDFYLRIINYQYVRKDFNNKLRYLGSNLSYRLTRKLSFSILGEVALRKKTQNYRINLKLIKRFDNKKKKNK